MRGASSSTTSRRSRRTAALSCTSTAGRSPSASGFIDDLGGHGLLDRLPELRSALVVFHAPGDEVVEIEQARRIFDAAPHPKSFVSLADADHLLTRPEDAQLVADLLCTWGSRYLD
jgi:fermentation-respiration switch protein FrsA (DUF1100 family)